MTKTRKVSIAVGVLLLTVAVGLGQGPFPFAEDDFADPGQLIRNPQVLDDLNIKPAQIKKLDAAILKAIGDVLDANQFKRLKQISLQLRGFHVFTDDKILEELKFTGKQLDSVNAIMVEYARKWRALSQDKEFQKIPKLKKETLANVILVLSDAQKRQWKEMIGPKFEMQFGKFGKGKGKKKDDE